MSRRWRLWLFLLAWLCVLPAAVGIACRMPPFGHHPLLYGEAINAVATAERHVTNAVTAVNFDYRGLDTLGEEFMLLCAVTGVTVLLRGPRGEQTSARPGRVPGRAPAGRSDALVLACRLFAPPTILFALSMTLHVATTPGGGFQSGVILAAAALLIFLGEGYRGWRRAMPSEALDACEAAGAALYAVSGFVPIAMGLPFLQNILPLGTPGDLLAGGLILVLNAGVTLAVAGSFAVLFLEFLEETRMERDGAEA